MQDDDEEGTDVKKRIDARRESKACWPTAPIPPPLGPDPPA